MEVLGWTAIILGVLALFSAGGAGIAAYLLQVLRRGG